MAGPIDSIIAAFNRLGWRLSGPRSPLSAPLSRRPNRDPGGREPPQLVASWDRKFEEVQRIVQQHEMGLFRSSGLIADTLDRNPRIYGALNNRAQGVVSSPFSVLPGIGDKRRAAAVARAFEEDWPAICPEGVIADVVRSMTVMGFAICRCLNIRVGRRWLPVLQPYPLAYVRYDWSRDLLIAVTTDRGEVPIVPGDGTWVMFASSRLRPWMRGVVRCLSLPAETRGYAVRDWARWSEKHGLPIIELKVPAQKADGAEAAQFFAQWRELASDSVIVSPQGEKDQASFGVNLLEAKDTAWEGFKELIARQDGDVSIAIEGQNLATENTGAGTYASAKVGQSVKQDLREADAYIVATTLHEQVARAWALWNFGDEALAPWAVYDPTPPEDLRAFADTMKVLGEALGPWNTAAAGIDHEVDVQELAERFRVPLRKRTAQPSHIDADETEIEGADNAEGEDDVASARRSARRFLARHRHRGRIAA
jgi:phage gp29-like protein